jgi:hypothetical protein
MLNKLLIFALTVIALSAMQLTLAVPSKTKDKDAISDKTLQLALLDLTHQEAKQITSKINQTRSVRKKHLISKRRVSEKLPSNCLKWSAHQINRKAKRFEKAINDNSRQHRVDKHLVKAIITAESCFKIKAKSHAGAQGLMQLIPATAKRFGVRKSYNPQQNIRGGVKYLKFLKARYKGDLKKVLAAYNAGEGAVDKYNGIPPYKETKSYVKNVLIIYMRLNPKAGRVSAVYGVTKKGGKPGRHGWQYNRNLAPQLYKN